MLKLLSSILALGKALIEPLAFIMMGRTSEKSKRLREDNSELKRQNDNNIYGLDDADSFWVRNKDNDDMS